MKKPAWLIMPIRDECGHRAGTWTISAGVNPANVGKATDLIVKELARFIEAGVHCWGALG